MERRTQPDWIPLAVSTTVHLLLIMAAVGLSRRPAERDPADPSRDAEDVSRRVEMIYIPPAEVRLPPPRVRLPAPTPRPVKARKEPEAEPNAPPEAVRSEGSQVDDPGKSQGDAAGDAASKPAAPAAEQIPTLESEARRIFGRPRLATAPGAGPQATRPMEAYLPDDPDRCVPHPVASTDSSGPQYGTVVGRIFRQDDGMPLVGAHLQMLGAPYVAFTDNNGEYHFRFDLALVDNCRTQYVRVSAGGFESRLLVLVAGPNARSEDVRLRRK